MVITNVPIKTTDEIIDYTIKEFDDMVKAKMNELLKDPSGNTELLIPYENLGFLVRINNPGEM